jgi:Fur family transcriptional regulator, ferric uptake regulator
MAVQSQRNTRQRAAIRKAFEQAGRPLSPQQVLDAAQAEVDGLGIATVYRGIKALLEEGWLVPIELPGEPAVYEQAGKAHHHHFRCDSCTRVFELSGCVPNVDRLAQSGFLVRRHEVVLYGLCADCKRAVAARSRH